MYTTQKNLQDYSYKNIQNLDSKKVVLRSCLNVTVDSEGKVTDPTRLNESLTLIKELAGKAKQVIILGHLGRPEPLTMNKSLSFWNLLELMNQSLKEQGIEAKLVKSLEEAKSATDQVLLMENIRFFPGEESKNINERENFAKELSSLGDLFINDAFADYRESASTYDIAKFLQSYLGPVFLKEVESLSKLNDSPKPFIAVLGGAKLSEKLDALNSLLETADKVLVGGAMAYTLLKAKGVEIGNSLFEPEKLETAKEIIQKGGEKLLLPVDHLVSDLFSEESLNGTGQPIDDKNIPNGKVAVDIGPDTIQFYSDELAKAGTILWNGPMGVFEWELSSKGTLAIGKAIESNANAYKVAGGGDSIAAINKLGLKGYSHISTGGGAMLGIIAYDKFPTLDVIINK